MAANPNTIPMMTTWTKEYQVTHHKIPVYPAIANYRLEPDLQKGDTVKRTYRRQFIANDMSGAGEFTRQVIIDTEETLTIDKEKDASFYIKELDELKNHLPARTTYARAAATALHQQIDADVLGEYAQFTNALDASSGFGGTATHGIDTTPQNVHKLFSKSSLLLQRSNVHVNVPVKFTAVKDEDGGKNMPVAVISPDVYNAIIERLEGKDTAKGDEITNSGYVGKYFNYNLFVSNGLAWTGTLNMATNPTDGDTITIMGITYTFKATLGSTAGNVHIASTVDITRANLAEAINNPSTTEAEDTDTGYVAVSATPDSAGFSNQDRLKNVVATDNASPNTLTIVAKGKGYVPVSSTLTAVADGFDANLNIQHCLIGIEGAIDLVIRRAPKRDERKRDGHVGHDVITWTCYGKKVFNDGKPKMVDVKVLTSNYSGDDGN
jgi:hypothetical protein